MVWLYGTEKLVNFKTPLGIYKEPRSVRTSFYLAFKLIRAEPEFDTFTRKIGVHLDECILNNVRHLVYILIRFTLIYLTLKFKTSVENSNVVAKGSPVVARDNTSHMIKTTLINKHKTCAQIVSDISKIHKILISTWFPDLFWLRLKHVCLTLSDYERINRHARRIEMFSMHSPLAFRRRFFKASVTSRLSGN